MDDDAPKTDVSAWNGLLVGKQPVKVSLRIEAILESQSESRGGSLPFQTLASDGNVYWVKIIQNRQGPRVLATEQIVSACGRHIGAPVCETALIEISEFFDGNTLDNGTVLCAGIAHASRDRVIQLTPPDTICSIW